MSLGYSRLTSGHYGRFPRTGNDENQNGENFLDERKIGIMALCEIINKDIKKNGDIWVVRDERYVITRFLFAFSAGDRGALAAAQRCRTDADAFIAEIQQSIAAAW